MPIEVMLCRRCDIGSFWTDTSYYQKPIDRSYLHPFASWRMADGAFIDPLAGTNKAACLSLIASGQMVGHLGYYVPRPYNMSTDAALRCIQAAVGTPDTRFAVMQDVESWGGAIGGDHSDYFNDLHTKVSNWLGSRKRVIGYANHGDYYGLWSRIAPDIRVVGAGYGVNPNLPRQIAWQYSNGQTQWYRPAGWPYSSAPFGPCDHNYSDLTPTQLAAELGLGSSIIVPALDPVEEIMAFYKSKAEFEQALRANAKSGVWDGNSVSWWLTRFLLALAGRHGNQAFSGAMLTAYKADGKTVDQVATAKNLATYGYLFNDQPDRVLLLDLQKKLATGTEPPVLLYTRPKTKSRAFQPVNDGAERRWVSSAQSAAWVQGFRLIPLADNDPFWDVPSLTANAEAEADRIEALDAAQNTPTGA